MSSAQQSINQAVTVRLVFSWLALLSTPIYGIILGFLMTEFIVLFLNMTSGKTMHDSFTTPLLLILLVLGFFSGIAVGIGRSYRIALEARNNVLLQNIVNNQNVMIMELRRINEEE